MECSDLGTERFPEISLWSYMFRHILVTLQTRRRVETQDSKLIMRTPLSQLQQLYGIRMKPVGFELANAASLIAIAKIVESVGAPVSEVVRSSALDLTTPRNPPQPTQVFAAAVGFYRESSGEAVECTLQRRQEAKRAITHGAIEIQSMTAY